MTTAEKTIDYYRSAIEYNETLAKTAEELSKSLENDVVKKWCASIGKQHRFHANLHSRALKKLLDREAKGIDDKAEDISPEIEVSPTINIKADEQPAPQPVEVSPSAPENVAKTDG